MIDPCYDMPLSAPPRNLRIRSFRKGRLSQQVVAELERLLLEEFPSPGDRWPKESDLALRFGVSRIVIREAIKVLEDRGEIEACAGSGTFTRAPNLDRVKASLLRFLSNSPIPTEQAMEEMLELRELLEETSASLAAVRATGEDLKAIEAALAELKDDPSDLPQTVRADLRFHLAVAKATHNRFLEMILEPLTQVFLQQIALANYFTVGVELHQKVYEQVRAGNSVGARQAVRRLMRETRKDVRNALHLIQSASSGESL